MKQLSRGRIAESELAGITERFGLGEAQHVSFIAEGMMNPNWRLETERGVFALKLIVDVTLPKARMSLKVLSVLGDERLPICVPRLAGGDTVVEIDGRGYCVLEWAEGAHRPGTALDLGEARGLGELVGRVHVGLSSPRTGLDRPAETLRAKVTTPEAALGEANRFLDVIAAMDEVGPFDIDVRERLDHRKALITAHAGQRPVDEVPVGPSGWTHGDLQPLNLLWQEGVVTAVLDWDRLAVRPYAEEVVRTAQVQFTTDEGRLDLAQVSAFVTGYRSVVVISDEALADAVQRLWWKRMTDFWQLQWHYDKDDHGPDALWVSGERLLGWWSEHLDEVQAAFQAG
ncbi:phosphotransferase [Sphaerisporangium sp. NPDC088356]|uniref:phosphotransferase n=1 Tax=Sphaerisporangium sp. NPDC088356 TaxID=3154871 RepID=UPI003431621A